MRVLRVAIAVFLTALAGAALASADAITQQGNLRVSVNGKLTPKTLPRKGVAPVAVTVGGQVSTTDGTEPPQLQKITIEINRHGRLESTGLPVCRASQVATASNGRALATCGDALVGEGKFSGSITLPASAPYPIEGKLLVFNGREHGRPTLLGHIYSPHPFATSFVISFAISREARGNYGTILTADLRKALGSKKNLTGIEMTLSRRYSSSGRRRSYVSAGCPAPPGLHSVSYPLARTTFTFADGSKLGTVLSRTCGARG